MRCCSYLKIQDDAIRSKGEATSPTRSAINLCAPDRIVLPEPYILHDPKLSGEAGIARTGRRRMATILRIFMIWVCHDGYA